MLARIADHPASRLHEQLQSYAVAVQAAAARSIRATCTACQAWPRPPGVGTPRAVNALATPSSVRTPAARISATTGARLRALGHRRGARLIRRAGAQGGVAEPDAARLRRRQRRLGPGRDHARLLLGHRGEDVHGQAVHRGHVGGDELDTGLHQPRDESDVAREPVELGDHQHRLVRPAGGERGGELRPIPFPPAFHLDELGGDAPLRRGDVPPDGRALCFQAEAALPLLAGRDAVVGHEAGRRRRHGRPSSPSSSSPGRGGFPRPARARMSRARPGVARAARAAK